MIPDTIGPYRVGRRLGGGAMGEVYLATDTRPAPGRRDQGPPDESGPGHRPSASRAAPRSARGRQPLASSIATVFDVIEKEDEVFLVMEYVPGETLAARIKPAACRPRSPSASRRDIADALACAHRSGIYHCDLKPRNIIVTPAGSVKILDFGLARSVAPARDDATGEYDSAGDVARARHAALHGPGSPERRRGGQPIGHLQPRRHDVRNVLRGAAIRRAGPAEPGRVVMAHAPPPLSARSPDVPRELEQVIDRAMARDARDRYQSADDLHQALQGVTAARRRGRDARPPGGARLIPSRRAAPPSSAPIAGDRRGGAPGRGRGVHVGDSAAAGTDPPPLPRRRRGRHRAGIAKRPAIGKSSRPALPTCSSTSCLRFRISSWRRLPPAEMPAAGSTPRRRRAEPRRVSSRRANRRGDGGIRPAQGGTASRLSRPAAVDADRVRPDGGPLRSSKGSSAPR